MEGLREREFPEFSYCWGWSGFVRSLISGSGYTDYGYNIHTYLGYSGDGREPACPGEFAVSIL